MSARNAAFLERVQQSRQSGDRLRAVRVRVREIISADDTLRNILVRVSNCGEDGYFLNSEEGQDFKISLLGDDNILNGPYYSAEAESSIKSDNTKNGTKNCQVKISKVTKLHKVACLKHYIRQKRMRRAAKQALIKKKIESIKNLMEDWNRTLSQVINTPPPSKFCVTGFDRVSQASSASKPTFPGSIGSVSDHDMPNNPVFEDSYNQHWGQNSYNPYDDEAEQNEPYDQQGYDGNNYEHHMREVTVATATTGLFILPEETNSEVALENMGKENNNHGYPFVKCRDYVAV